MFKGRRLQGSYILNYTNSSLTFDNTEDMEYDMFSKAEDGWDDLSWIQLGGNY